MAVVDFDHGVGRNDSYADYGELHYLIEDNIGNMNFSIPADGTDPDNWVNTHLVYDMDIFNQTGLGKTFFAFINTCASGSIETSLLGFYPGLPYGGGNNTNGKPVGMPYAWTHRTVGNRSDPSFSLALNMSIDGYVDADGGDFCYLGYTWGSAALSQIVDPNYPTVPHGAWVSKFFQFALADDVTVNQALDLASYNKYSSSFGESLLCQNFTAEWPMYRYNETAQEWQWRTDRGYNCTLAVYGNGDVSLYQPFLNITAADDGGSPLSVSVTIDGESVGSTNVSERVSNFPAEDHTIEVSVPNGYVFQNFTVGANTYVTNPATISVTSDTSVVAYFTEEQAQDIPVTVVINSVPYDGYARYHALTVDNDIPTVFWSGAWYTQNQDAIIAITSQTVNYGTTYYLTEGYHTIEYAVSSIEGYEWYATLTVNSQVEAQQYTQRYDQVSEQIHVTSGTSYTLTISAGTGGTTSPSPGGHSYSSGTPVQVTAIEYTDYDFNYWSLDGSPQYNNPITVTMNSNHNLHAYFTYNPPPPPSHYVTIEVWGYYPPWTLMYQGGQYMQEGPQQFSAPSAYGGLPFYAWYHDGNYYYTQSLWISIYSDTYLAALYSY